MLSYVKKTRNPPNNKMPPTFPKFLDQIPPMIGYFCPCPTITVSLRESRSSALLHSGGPPVRHVPMLANTRTLYAKLSNFSANFPGWSQACSQETEGGEGGQTSPLGVWKQFLCHVVHVRVIN